MGRIRTIKPEIAKHELLFEIEQNSSLPIRFAWAMLPTVCDREGRFKWRPRSLKSDMLPFDAIEFEDVLDALLQNGFIVKYRIGDDWFGAIPTFLDHQRVSPKEPRSNIPPGDDADEVVDRRTIKSPVSGIGIPKTDRWKGREGKGTGKEGRKDSPEPPSVSAPVTNSPMFLEFPVIGTEGPTWALTEAQVVEWARLFPNLDVRQESRKALAWVLATPGRRKTSRGMGKFLVGWFSRTSDRSRPSAPRNGRVPEWAQ